MNQNKASRPRQKKKIGFFLCFISLTLLLSPFDLPKSIAQSRPATNIVRPILRVGSRGVAVSELQAALKLLGYYTGRVNGAFDESTARAVTRFQRAAGLTADGIVGPSTWEQLFPQTQISTASTNAAPSRPAPTNAEPSRPASNAPSSTSASQISAASFPVPSATNQSAPSNTNVAAQQPSVGDLPILKLGTRSPAVFWLQKRLQITGFFQGTVDGVFGSDTEVAVKAAQRSFGLNADGVVGNATWRVLLP